MIETLWESALSHPWAFIALGTTWVAWKTGKWIATQVLDDENGIIPKHLKSLNDDSKAMKDAIVEVARSNANSLASFQNTILESLKDNKVAIESLERQLVSAIQARPDDEELFDVLFSQNPIPICFIGDDNKFIRSNDACEELWGYSSGELSGMSFADITHDDDIEADMENVQLVKSGTRKRYRMEKTYICKSGKTKRCALHVFRYPGQGAFIHFISIVIPL